MRSRKIISSHSSHVNTSTSGRPLWPGKDSKKRSSFPQNGQASKALSNIGPNFIDEISFRWVVPAKFLVSHFHCCNKIALFILQAAHTSRLCNPCPAFRHRPHPSRAGGSQACGGLNVELLTSIVRRITPARTNHPAATSQGLRRIISLKVWPSLP